jgi:lipopolysaccharide/colanic/teichoic acid biosynthesis glycosyltransferase
MRELGIMHFEERPVYSIESFYEKYWSKVMLNLVNRGWPLQANFVLIKSTPYSEIKRLMDFFFALIALIILSPLMILIILAVFLIDGTPVIYSQERIGIHQIPFRLFKFRTMRALSDLGDRYTQEGDSRITSLGRILRKMRLDELPQFWNVLLGDMSLIGPRPEWFKLVEDYELLVPYYHFRHLVRPGITGWAQVNYPYGTSVEDTLQKLSYDLYYIQNYSLRLDVSVILKTVFVIFSGRGH